jgi:hypothetical protein
VVAKPRRTRRKVTAVKYVESEPEVHSSEEEGGLEGKDEDDGDGDQEWKPEMEEEDGEEEVEKTGAEKKIDGGDAAPDAAVKEEVGDLDDEEERVTEEIKDVSSKLQANMNGGNFAVVV